MMATTGSRVMPRVGVALGRSRVAVPIVGSGLHRSRVRVPTWLASLALGRGPQLSFFWQVVLAHRTLSWARDSRIRS